jgi:hypothetical protein
LEYKEKRFEQDIESFMLSLGGYTKGDMSAYDAGMAIDLPVLVEFIKKTQEKEWQRYETVYGGNAEKKLYKRFNEEVNTHGLIHVLRNGIVDRGVKIKVCYFKPESTLNPKSVENYNNNILNITRQFAYSTENRNTIDMVISINGIPIIALELKNQITGQSVENAKKQFMYDRNKKELCFHFNKKSMSSFIINGGKKLKGEIIPQGAKNEALQVISAVLLTSEKVTKTTIVELSQGVIDMHPNINPLHNIIKADVYSFEPSETFDVIVLDLWYDKVDEEVVTNLVTKYTSYLKPGGKLHYLKTIIK